MTMIIIAFIFIVLMIFPLLGAYLYYKSQKGKVLYINQDKVRNPRYFATSFSNMIETRWEESKNEETIKLSHDEKLIKADIIENLPNPCKAIVVAKEKPFEPSPGIFFEKEIYSEKSASLNGPMEIRAIACKGKLKIGSNVRVVRWADSVDSLSIEDNCDLGMSITSLKEIIVGENCTFKRLYAPIIYLGQYSKKTMSITKPKVEGEGKFNIIRDNKRDLEYVNESMLNNEGIAYFSVITKKDIIILEKIIVYGHIRSEKNIRICDNAIIFGNVFAEGNIKIGRNVLIIGNVFSQESISIDEDSVIGEDNNISSVIARETITIEKNCIIYGYIGNEHGGKIAPKHLNILN